MNRSHRVKRVFVAGRRGVPLGPTFLPMAVEATLDE